MHSLKTDSAEYALDKNGYLASLDDWSPEVAAAFAMHENLELSEQHWKVIYFVREFYETYDTSPAIRVLVKALKDAYGEEVGNSRFLQRLFPNGPAKVACKLAGLPKPAKCL
ncbi:MAG: TusE/DsrC/DsvC family sulfur relay protein [Pseudomonadota bacterium]